MRSDGGCGAARERTTSYSMAALQSIMHEWCPKRTAEGNGNRVAFIVSIRPGHPVRSLMLLSALIEFVVLAGGLGIVWGAGKPEIRRFGKVAFSDSIHGLA